MTAETVKMVVDYCDSQRALVQITQNQGEWIADFASNLHAKVCCNELAEKGVTVELNPSVEGIAYFARLL